MTVDDDRDILRNNKNILKYYIVAYWLFKLLLDSSEAVMISRKKKWKGTDILEFKA